MSAPASVRDLWRHWRGNGLDVVAAAWMTFACLIGGTKIVRVAPPDAIVRPKQEPPK